jgi:hypothetical protein
VREIYSKNTSQIFENEHCKFKPFDWQEVDGISRPILFKVVTNDLRSLGLRHNPNIMYFPVGEWVRLSNDQLLAAKKDWGGIWSALRLSGARTLIKYMIEKYDTATRTFLAALDNPLYANSYRVKSQAVILLKEVNL